MPETESNRMMVRTLLNGNKVDDAVKEECGDDDDIDDDDDYNDDKVKQIDCEVIRHISAADWGEYSDNKNDYNDADDYDDDDDKVKQNDSEGTGY